MSPRPCFFFFSIASLAVFLAASPVLAQDGLFARIATNTGSVRVSLDYQRAPRAVANFVALAEGTQAHIDFAKGKVETGRFYDGMTFHHVNASYIQAGPMGIGRAGSAGYVSGVEPNPELTHEEPFMIAMLGTSEGPSTGQFIITVQSNPSLNTTHPVFGRVVEGEQTARNIAQTPSANGTPLEPVVIQSVTIERNGTAAAAFDTAAQGLPALADAPVRLRRDAQGFVLTSDFVAGSTYLWFSSVDLREWDHFTTTVVGNTVSPSLSERVETPSLFGREFFRVVEIDYPPGTTPAPGSMINKALTLDISLYGATPTQSTLVYEFFSDRSGRVLNGSARPVQFGAYFYAVKEEARSLLIVPAEEMIKPLNLLQITLSFMSLTHGSFEAFLPYAIPATTLYGAFTLLPRS